MALGLDGRFLTDHLRRVRLTEQDVQAAVRKRGYTSLDAIHLAVMETNGEIGVVPQDRPATRASGPSPVPPLP